MDISDEMIEKFQTLYQKQFGRKLNKDEAREKGTRLVNLVKLAYQPIPNDHYHESKITNHTN